MEKKNKKEKSLIGWVILGAVFPIVGLVLYFVWKKSKTDVAKKVIEGTIVGAILAVIYGILFEIIVGFYLLPTVSNLFATHVCIREYGTDYRVIEIDKSYKCKNIKTEEYKDFPWKTKESSDEE